MSNFHRSCLSELLVFGALGALVAGQAPPQATAPAPGQPATTAQTPQRTPPRGRPGDQPPVTGTAIIRGTVVAADNGQPLRKVQVRAISMDGRGGGITSTNAQGRYEIKDLPAGRFSLAASKGVYVTMSYGAKRPSDPGTPIELADGQLAEKVNFSLVRGGVIAGRVVDETGEAMPGINMSAQRFAFMGGSRRLMPAGSGARTDDTGAYRLYGLAPGEYYVNASGTSGSNFVMNGAAMSNTESDGYAPSYYPGTSNINEAQRVTIKAGQELLGIHFIFTPTRLAKIRGRVLNSHGEPARGMVTMTPGDPYLGFTMVSTSSTSLTNDGAFLLNNVAPGRYNLNIRPGGMQSPESEFAVVPLTVGSDDLDNVIVTTNIGATVRGVIQTDDGQPPPFRPDEVSVGAGPVEPTMMIVSAGPPKINNDYTFELTGLFDRRLVRGAIGNQSGWYLKAVYFDGDDVTDSGIEFTPGRSYEGLQLIFTQKATELSGLVTDSRGRPVTDATVIIFPASRERWTSSSRYIRTARPDTQGRYSFKGLPPHDDYMVIAVQNLESGQGSDPEFLTRAREEAKSLGLTEGEKKAFDVKLSPLVP
jgi:hypothetical protein